MTAALRPLGGVVFAAMLALSLIVSTLDALAYSAGDPAGDGILLDRIGTRGGKVFPQRPFGDLGIVWEGITWE